MLNLCTLASHLGRPVVAPHVADEAGHDLSVRLERGIEALGERVRPVVRRVVVHVGRQREVAAPRVHARHG